MHSKSGSQESLAQITKHSEIVMGKTWKAFSLVSVQISLQVWRFAVGAVKNFAFVKALIQQNTVFSKYFELSTILIILLKRNRLYQVLKSFFPLLPRLQCIAI